MTLQSVEPEDVRPIQLFDEGGAIDETMSSLLSHVIAAIDREHAKEIAELNCRIDQLEKTIAENSTRTFRPRSTFDPHTIYSKLDLVSLDGGAFLARYDNPGPCPGEGWQLVSRQGKRGRQGIAGANAEPITKWIVDVDRCVVIPILTNGRFAPELDLRPLFER